MSQKQEEGELMVISSSDDEGLVVANDSLTADDLPLGEHKEKDRQSATRICELLNEHGKSMLRSVRDKIIKMLKDGIFHHTAASKVQSSMHQLHQKMWDSEFMSPNWINITYENWFILSGVYDQKKLSESNGGKAIMKALQRRYGPSLGTSLAYENGPVDIGPHVRDFLLQAGDTTSSNTEDISKLKLEMEKLQLEIEKLRDQVEAICSADDDGYDHLELHDKDDEYDEYDEYDEDEDGYYNNGPAW